MAVTPVRAPGRAPGLRRAPEALLGVSVAAVLTLTACGTGFSDAPSGQDGGPLTVLIAPSEDAEKVSVNEAVAEWSEASGTPANVGEAADLPQQLSQGFAAGNPPDVFYVGPDFFAGYAQNGFLEPYGDQVDTDFYPTLVDSFTYEDTFYCAPKDFSTLQLVVNDAAWERAGLTDADYPTTWAELQDVAARLTTDDQVGLTFGPEWQRVGVFMAQAGGHLVDDGGHADVDTPQNVEALEYVKTLLADGVAAYPADIGAGWGGEAFGTEAAAMTIEGNWIVGSLAHDYPDVDYTVVPLPNGPGGEGTLQFTNCWGIAADSGNKSAAIDLVQHLVADDQQMTFAKEYGVMPSSRPVADQWRAEFPAQSAFLDGADAAQGVPPIEGIADVLGDFNSQLEGLKNGDPQAILGSAQGTLSAVAP